MKKAGKPVFVIDYPTSSGKIKDFYNKALNKGYVPYVNNRDLDKLQINSGFEPD